ncbi:hypothetical protein [Neisseria weaveri]|uniref:hypothetical protein n=1 Tax=Neisseria weaveri TaxID=28091 RepID=UPI0011455099|nr:hypothetical protein [Neisseria weaveri]
MPIKNRAKMPDPIKLLRRPFVGRTRRRSDTRIRQSAQTSRNSPQSRIQESDLHHSYLRPSENSASNSQTAYIFFRRHWVGRILVSDNPPKLPATSHNVGFNNPTYIIRI